MILTRRKSFIRTRPCVLTISDETLCPWPARMRATRACMAAMRRAVLRRLALLFSVLRRPVARAPARGCYGEVCLLVRYFLTVQLCELVHALKGASTRLLRKATLGSLLHTASSITSSRLVPLHPVAVARRTASSAKTSCSSALRSERAGAFGAYHPALKGQALRPA